MNDFNLQEFANDVYYAMKKTGSRDIATIDARNGSNFTGIIEEQRQAGNFNNAEFTEALVNANNTYADDAVEGLVKGTDRIATMQSLIQRCEATGNKDLTDSVKDLCRAVIQNDIQTGTVHTPTIHTNARFHLHDTVTTAIQNGLDGDVSGLKELAGRTDDDVNYASEAKLVRAEIRAHLAENPPAQEQKTGLAATADAAYRPPQT